MPASDIVIKGAREHNLRNVDVVLPRNQLICLTGVSGSRQKLAGVRHALCRRAAAVRRKPVQLRPAVPGADAQARRRLHQRPEPVDFDLAEVVRQQPALDRRHDHRDLRLSCACSSPASATGIAPKCGRPITAQTREQIIAPHPDDCRPERSSPCWRPSFAARRASTKTCSRICGSRVSSGPASTARVVSLTDDLSLDRQMRHNIEVVIDRLKAARAIRGRLAEAVELALRIGQGQPRSSRRRRKMDAGARVRAVDDVTDEERAGTSSNPDGAEDRPARSDPSVAAPPAPQPGDIVLSSHFACTDCGISFERADAAALQLQQPARHVPRRATAWARFFSFDPDRLIATPEKSFDQGCIELIGPWKDLGRWKRHIYRGVAETMERKLGLAEGTLLGTPWQRSRRRTARYLALGHRRRAHHVHVAGRQSRPEVRRHVRRPDPGAAGKIPHQQKHAADQRSSKST